MRIKKDIFFSAFIFFIALIVRIVWIYFSPAIPKSDFSAYHYSAFRLLSGEMYWADEHLFPVGYPLFLALIYLILGKKILAAKLVNVVLGAFSSVLIYMLAYEFFKSRKTSFLAGISLAVYPQYVYYSSLLASENLAIFLLLLVVYLFYTGINKKSLNIIVFSGFLFSYLLLVRPNFIIFLFLMPIWLVLNSCEFKRCVLLCLVFTAMSFSLVIPWVLINYFHSGELILISPNGGINLYIGNNPYARGKYKWPVPGLDIEGKSLTQIDREARRKAISYIIDHPRAFLIRGDWKLDYLFSPLADGALWNYWSLDADKNKAQFTRFMKLKDLLSAIEIRSMEYLKWLAFLGVILSLRKKSSWLGLLIIFGFLAVTFVFLESLATDFR